MSFNPRAELTNRYYMMYLPKSELLTISAPKENDLSPEKKIVYLLEADAQVYVVKPISEKNTECLFEKNQIRKEMRLGTIQQFADAILVSFHSKFTPPNSINLELEFEGKKISLGKITNFCPLTDKSYNAIDAIYANFLDDMYAALTKGNNENAEAEQLPAKKKEAGCVIF